MNHFPITLDDKVFQRTGFSKSDEVRKEHKLTIYDAAYLSLAIELEAPLLTFDKALLAATHVLRIKTDI